MSFNVLYGGTALGCSIAETARLIRDSRADIVVLPEANSCEITLGEELDWHHYRLRLSHAKSHKIGIVSRFNLHHHNDNGVLIYPEDQQSIVVCGAHLSPYPYEPYYLRDNPDPNIANCINSASRRVIEIQQVLSTTCAIENPNSPIILCGDFNEPSHLDWTETATHLHRGYQVNWPVSMYLEEAGFKDAYREYFPNEVSHPGFTWTTLNTETGKIAVERHASQQQTSKLDSPGLAAEVHDRIDFIYYRGKQLSLENTWIIGERAENADLVIQPFPSDHRAVVADFSIKN